MGNRIQRGFTLVEMLVVVTILGILAAIATPNMGRMIRTQKVKTAAFDIFSSLVLTRGEAIKRGVSVTMTPNAGDWSKGWTIIDVNGNTVGGQANYSMLTIAGPGSVTYAGNGRVTGIVAPQFAVSAADVDSASQRCIRVDLSGRPVSKEGTCT